MNEPVFLFINHDFIAEQILLSKKSIFLAIPGITKKISDALIESNQRLKGWDKITVVIDSSYKVYYLGYAEHEAFQKLERSGCNIKCEKNLRIGLLIVDSGEVFVFSPISLNLESNDDSATSINALALQDKVSKAIIEAVSPGSVSIEPEIGKREISEIEIKRVEKAITSNPPQKPDLTRKISVLTSKFQFIDLSFRGSQLKNTKVSLNATELGIIDKDLVERISGQYRVFEKLPKKYEDGMQDLKNKYKKLKNYYTKTIGDYGTIIWVSTSKEFENAIQSLQGEISKFNKEIVLEINNSKEKLKKFMHENYKVDQQRSFDQILAQTNVENVIEIIIEKAFSSYTLDELEKNLELKYKYYSISSQMASDEGFNKKIEEVLRVKLDDLVKVENAFGVNKGV